VADRCEDAKEPSASVKKRGGGRGEFLAQLSDYQPVKKEIVA
jgi:hypothetical protein